jgi:endoglucanase
MKLFRKSLTLMLLAFVILLGACAGDGTEPAEDPADPDNNVETNEPEEPEGEPTLANLRARPLTELTALEMTRVMGHGVNLGNTMEACTINAGRVPMRDPSIYEQMWGQPITTQEMIQGKKDAGFATLRVPVAWTNGMNFAVNSELDYENWDFTINPALLDRVEEIINYALNADMIVIVNNHWDHGWWSMFGHPEQEIRDLAMELYITMWTQVAERYKHFDGRLIFESANEELGNRLNDETVFSPTGGTLNEDERYIMTTKINQTFIDVVRGTGGNNAERFLLVKGFCTDVKKTIDERFIMPVDPANKLILGVHYYTPWSYCGDTSGVGGWGTTAEVEEMNGLLGSLTKFTEQGYGILIGEWGVLDNVGEDRFNFFTNFLALCDKYGFATTLWDTGGVYCRKLNEIRDCKVNHANRDECRNDDDAIDKIAKLFKSVCVDTRRDMTIDDIVFSADMTLIAALRRAENRPQFIYTADEAFAWIMYACGDWAIQYSNSDQYRPDNVPPGLVPHDVEVKGAGTYTVGLDFTGTSGGFARGFEFAAVGIVNAEVLWPGYIMEITEVLINGEPAQLNGIPYTTNDNPVTTRINLYNAWVQNFRDGEWTALDNSSLKDARVPGGDLTGTSPVPLIDYSQTRIETLQVTFNYFPPE